MVLFSKISTSQSNLIRNGSFENFSNQNNPSLEGQFDCYNPAYIKIVQVWDIINSPDYFNSAYSAGGYNVPYATVGYSYAKHGNAYAGFIGYYAHPTIEIKEYVYQQLTSPLIADSVYCLSFNVTFADRAKVAIKNIGVYFTVNTPTASSSGYIQAAPQVLNTTGFITDTINWTEIKGCFIAQGGEKFVTIGNFNSNINTDTLNTNTTNPITTGTVNFAYYYLDSVSLYKNSFPTGIKALTQENKISIYPNPANDLLNFQFSDADKKRKVELYDAIGNLVLSENLTTQNSSLNIHHLQSGIYFYEVLVGNKIMKTDEIVIIK
jgi:hypothetical protein